MVDLSIVLLVYQSIPLLFVAFCVSISGAAARGQGALVEVVLPRFVALDEVQELFELLAESRLSMLNPKMMISILVGGLNPSEKYDCVIIPNWDDLFNISQYMENKTCSKRPTRYIGIRENKNVKIQE